MALHSMDHKGCSFETSLQAFIVLKVILAKHFTLGNKVDYNGLGEKMLSLSVNMI